MMVIYMEQTVSILGQKEPERTEKLIQTGEIKQVKNRNGVQSIKYLKINKNENNNSITIKDESSTEH